MKENVEKFLVVEKKFQRNDETEFWKIFPRNRKYFITQGHLKEIPIDKNLEKSSGNFTTIVKTKEITQSVQTYGSIKKMSKNFRKKNLVYKSASMEEHFHVFAALRKEYPSAACSIFLHHPPTHPSKSENIFYKNVKTRSYKNKKVIDPSRVQTCDLCNDIRLPYTLPYRTRKYTPLVRLKGNTFAFGNVFLGRVPK